MGSSKKSAVVQAEQINLAESALKTVLIEAQESLLKFDDLVLAVAFSHLSWEVVEYHMEEPEVFFRQLCTAVINDAARNVQ